MELDLRNDRSRSKANQVLLEARPAEESGYRNAAWHFAYMSPAALSHSRLVLRAEHLNGVQSIRNAGPTSLLAQCDGIHQPQ